MLRVMVVDDSAVVRQVMTGLLQRDPQIRVTTAADPIFAMEKMKRVRPDVIVLDVEMPRMNGLTFLRMLMATDPLPVVVCSGFSGPGTAASLRALRSGAVDIITKPVLGVRDFLNDTADEILDVIRAAGKARVRPLGLPRRPHVTVGPAPAASHEENTDRVVAIGASTGGTEAIRAILGRLPLESDGILIVQHMPEYFTAAFAQQLNKTCPIEVKEASNGDVVRRGLALIARGDHHLVLRRTAGGDFVAGVTQGPRVDRHRPSVNVLFRSVAEVAGARGVGVLLTGMGNDGADGLLEMRRAGGTTIAQDEASCVVFGMPKEAIDRGAAQQVVSLTQIAACLACKGSQRRRGVS